MLLPLRKSFWQFLSLKKKSKNLVYANAIWYSNYSYEHLSQRNKTWYPHKNLYVKVYSNLVHNTQPKIAQMSFNGQIGTSCDLFRPLNITMLSDLNKWNFYKQYVDRSWESHAEGWEVITNSTCCGGLFKKHSWDTNFIEMEDGLVVTRGAGGGRNEKQVCTIR